MTCFFKNFILLPLRLFARRKHFSHLKTHMLRSRPLQPTCGRPGLEGARERLVQSPRSAWGVPSVGWPQLLRGAPVLPGPAGREGEGVFRHKCDGLEPRACTSRCPSAPCASWSLPRHVVMDSLLVTLSCV